MSEPADDILAALAQRRRAFERCLAQPQVQVYLINYERNGGRVAFAVCPCCGYPTLRERGSHRICQICRWQDDGQDDPDFAPRPGYYLADEIAGGPNASYSLTEARLNFKQFRQMYRPSDTRPSDGTSQDRPLREAIIGIFDALLPDVSELSYLTAVPKIEEASHRISESLHKRIEAREE